MVILSIVTETLMLFSPSSNGGVPSGISGVTVIVSSPSGVVIGISITISPVLMLSPGPLSGKSGTSIVISPPPSTFNS